MQRPGRRRGGGGWVWDRAGASRSAPVPTPRPGALQPSRRHYFQKVPAAEAKKGAAAPAHCSCSPVATLFPHGPPPVLWHPASPLFPVVGARRGTSRSARPAARSPAEGARPCPSPSGRGAERCSDVVPPLPPHLPSRLPNGVTIAATPARSHPVPCVRATWAGRGQWELRGALLQRRRWEGGGERQRQRRVRGREGWGGESGRGRGVFKPDSHSGRSGG